MEPGLALAEDRWGAVLNAKEASGKGSFPGEPGSPGNPFCALRARERRAWAALRRNALPLSPADWPKPPGGAAANLTA